MRPLVPLLACAAVWVAAPAAQPEVGASQPVDFGAADDLFERGAAEGVDGLRAGAFAGPAYLDGWRLALYAEADARAGRVSGALAGALHPGSGGLYRGEADAASDALRAIAYLRLNPTPTSRLYLRAGSMARVSLGSGALVRHYGTQPAPDERPLGVEGVAEIGAVRVAAFTGDVRLRGISGAEVQVTTRRRLGPLARVGATLAGVHDLGTPAVGARRLSGAELTLRGELAGDGETFAVGPFATVAGYAGRGGTLGGGLDAGATSLGDAVRVRARVALFASSRRFVPGYVGPFYRVNGADGRIVAAESFYDDDPAVALAGTPLDSLRAGLDVVIDLRAVVFGRAEASQYLRRHVGADRASAYGLRLAGRLPGDVRLELALERQGFRGITGLLFGGLGEENLLVFDVGVPVGPAHLFVRSRYGYRRLADDETTDAAPRYLVERRFEPLVGVRIAP